MEKEKKGGINKPPKTPKPPIHPAGQGVPSEDDGKNQDELKTIALAAEELILPPVTSVGTGIEANVAGKKVLMIRKTRDELKAKVRELKLEIDKRLREAESKLAQAEEAMLDPLLSWAREHKDIRTSVGMTKTIKLDDCKVGFRRGQAKLDVIDETNALQFCKDRGLPVRTKELLDKRMLKDFLKDNREERDDEAFQYQPGESKFFLSEL